MKRPVIAGLALATATVVLVPLSITATTAAWNDAEWIHSDGVGTSTFDCGVDTGFAASASGRFLSGELLGIDLDTVAALAPVRVERAADGSTGVTPPNAINLGSTPPTSTYANPLQISLLSGIIGLDLTGLQVGLPVGSAGAVNQYAQVSGTGTATGAAGLVTNSGAVLVSADTPDDQLPEPATISLDDVLPAAAGIADVELQVGAVGSSAVLDGCALLRSALWGDEPVRGVTRDYGIAGLGLQLDSAVVAGLAGTVTTSLGSITTALNTLIGPTGLISREIATGIDLALSDLLGISALSGTVSITGIDLTGALGSLLTTPLSDGVVTVDLASGAIDVDLAALLGGAPNGLNDLAPNTELVLNSTVLNPIVDRIGALLDAWTGQIVAALRAEIRDAQLSINLSTVVRILGGINVLNVGIGFNGKIGALLDGGASLQITAEAAGVVGVINAALSLLGLPTVTQLVNSLLGITASLTASVANVVTSTALGAVTTLGSTVANAVTPLLTALDVIVGALPNLVSVMVNVQPDQPGPPVISADGRTAGPYSVSALRIGLGDALVPGDVAHVSFATASAGPVTRP